MFRYRGWVSRRRYEAQGGFQWFFRGSDLLCRYISTPWANWKKNFTAFQKTRLSESLIKFLLWNPAECLMTWWSVCVTNRMTESSVQLSLSGLKGDNLLGSWTVHQPSHCLNTCRLHPRSRLHVHQRHRDQHLRVLHPAQQVRDPGRVWPPQEGGEEQEPHGKWFSQSQCTIKIKLDNSKFSFCPSDVRKTMILIREACN